MSEFGAILARRRACAEAPPGAVGDRGGHGLGHPARPPRPERRACDMQLGRRQPHDGAWKPRAPAPPAPRRNRLCFAPRPHLSPTATMPSCSRRRSIFPDSTETLNLGASLARRHQRSHQRRAWSPPHCRLAGGERCAADSRRQPAGNDLRRWRSGAPARAFESHGTRDGTRRPERGQRLRRPLSDERSAFRLRARRALGSR